MKVPINWLKDYVDLKHNNNDIGNILTDLEFMQDGPIKDINGEPVIDLEVRQNRPDILSIIGVAREYAAYTNQKLKQIENLSINLNNQKLLLEINQKEKVKRFIAVVINNITQVQTPEYMVKYLTAYGIPTISFIVDVTNYVMLEYGIPMHAFDKDKLQSDNEILLKFRDANQGEKFITWQGTKINLTENDLIVTDGKNNIVGIAGITGEANSGISQTTKNIVLEAANYDHASVRRTALRTSLQTDAAIRHSKLLRSDMVEKAINRAAFLIQKYAGGEIKETEDYYGIKDTYNTISLNVKNVKRLGGIELTTEKICELLNRLSFETNQNGEEVIVKVPQYRTDVNLEEDVIEEVLRLYGYANIPFNEITATPPKKITPGILILENKLRQIAINLGLDEHITEPLVKSDKIVDQIILENPLNEEKNALRTNILQTLEIVKSNYIKAKKEKIRLFEIGKIYIKNGYKETKVLTALYHNIDFTEIKSDLVEFLNRINIKSYSCKILNGKLEYYFKDQIIAVLEKNSYTLYTQNIEPLVNNREIPTIDYHTSIVQKIEENVTINANNETDLENICKKIKETSLFIESVYIKDPKTQIYKSNSGTSITLTIVFIDPKNTLNKEKLAEIRNNINKVI